MKRIATMTVIRGEGECQAIVNGVIDRELQRKQEELRKEKEIIEARLSIVVKQRDRLLAEEMCRRKAYRPPLHRRILDTIETAYALTAATILLLGERLGILKWPRRWDSPSKNRARRIRRMKRDRKYYEEYMARETVRPRKKSSLFRHV